MLSALVRAFLVQAFFVPSASMEDTLLISDRIVASKITTTMSGTSRGEVVVFKDPGDWLPEPPPPPGGVRGALRTGLTFIGLLPSDTGQDLVKRVVGIEGDRVACCNAEGRIVLNGVPLVEDYIKGPTNQVQFDVVVPDDSVFVMGDNRGDSRDSRYHLEADNGAVPETDVVGRVALVIWPLSNFSTVPIPEIYADPQITRGPALAMPPATVSLRVERQLLAGGALLVLRRRRGGSRCAQRSGVGRHGRRGPVRAPLAARGSGRQALTPRARTAAGAAHPPLGRGLRGRARHCCRDRRGRHHRGPAPGGDAGAGGASRRAGRRPARREARLATPPPQDSLFDPPVDVCVPPVTMRIKADLTCASVAAASVLAKVERDAIMADLATCHPHYGWAGNKDMPARTTSRRSRSTARVRSTVGAGACPSPR